jgi:predicted AAA+ superfamily ATPase
VILIDELVAYVRQFEEGKTLTGGSFDSNLSFVQALTEALKAVPTAVLLASLPESDKEAGSQRGVKALAALAHYFGRIQALWKPVGTEEAFEIVRRRLFTSINDKLAAESVCRPSPITTRQQRGLSARDAGEPLFRPVDARLPDPPGGVRPPVRGLVVAGQFPAHPWCAEVDGQGDSSSVEGQRQRPADHARQLSACKTRTLATR